MTLRYWKYGAKIPAGWKILGHIRNGKGKLSNHSRYSYLIVKVGK